MSCVLGDVCGAVSYGNPVLVGLVFVMLVLLVAIFWLRKKSKKQKEEAKE